MVKHGIGWRLIKEKVTFMNGLKSKWMAVVSIVKARKQFENYSSAKLIGILKSHESVVMKEEKVVTGMWSLAPIVKRKLEHSEFVLTSEEYALMISNPKRFAR